MGCGKSKPKGDDKLGQGREVGSPVVAGGGKQQPQVSPSKAPPPSDGAGHQKASPEVATAAKRAAEVEAARIQAEATAYARRHVPDDPGPITPAGYSPSSTKPAKQAPAPLPALQEQERVAKDYHWPDTQSGQMEALGSLVAVKPKAKYNVGDIVEAQWEDDLEWQEATIDCYNGDGTYEVTWSEDDSWSVVPETKIRPRVLKATPELLDRYFFGRVLGQGTYGIVYRITSKADGKVYAVKMIDKVESPEENIKAEVDYLKQLEHPNVLKIHDVYFEKLFVCLVLDLMSGGDLIKGINWHWDNKGRPPALKSRHIIKQAIESIFWLHKNDVAHRDVKGDNFLIDKPNFCDQECRLILSDFGTAKVCTKDHRFTRSAGTKLYWSPELFRTPTDYGRTVDVWALGVALFALVQGGLPFKAKLKSVENKEPKLYIRSPPYCRELTLQLCNKTEEGRLDAEQASKHPWCDLTTEDGEGWQPPNVGGETESEESSLDSDDEENKPKDKPEGVLAVEAADEQVQERRQELIERLKDGHEKRGSITKGDAPKGDAAVAVKELPLKDFMTKETLRISDRNDGRLFGSGDFHTPVTYKWMSPKDIPEIQASMQKSSQSSNDDKAVESGADPESIVQMLVDHGVNLKNFGKNQAKKLDDFVKEVQTGGCRLMLDAAAHKKMVRVVDIVLLRTTHGEGKNQKTMIKKEEISGSSERKDLYQLEGTKREPSENMQQTAERILDERMGLGDIPVKFNFNTKEYFEEEEESPSYPGVLTVYRKEILHCSLAGDEPPHTKKKKASSVYKYVDAKGVSRTYEWLSERQCRALNIKIRATAEKDQISALVDPPVGAQAYFEEAKLGPYLTERGVSIKEFGKGNFKSVKDLGNELKRGWASLEEGEDDELVRVVDIVVMYLSRSPAGAESSPGRDEVFVQAEMTTADGKVMPLNRLPANKRRPDENQFIAAKRLIAKTLCLSPDSVTIASQAVRIQEEVKESTAYPLKSLYRKRIIMANLGPPPKRESTRVDQKPEKPVSTVASKKNVKNGDEAAAVNKKPSVAAKKKDNAPAADGDAKPRASKAAKPAAGRESKAPAADKPDKKPSAVDARKSGANGAKPKPPAKELE